MNNYFFFLGGKDLEMNAIKHLLVQENQAFADKGLTWGANVSAYEAEILDAKKRGFKPVLIELAGAETIPDSLIIDHHNQNSQKPASILQVLDLLGLTASREQKLIAANDSAYFEGMIKEGATLEEAFEIRKKEWAALEVSQEDIREAERGVNCAENFRNNAHIVRINHTRSSLVMDMLTAKFGLDRQDFLCISENEGVCTEINITGNGLLCKEFKECADKFNSGYSWGGNPNFGKDNNFPAYAGCSGELFGKKGASAEWAEAFFKDWTCLPF